MRPSGHPFDGTTSRGGVVAAVYGKTEVENAVTSGSVLTSPKEWSVREFAVIFP